MRIHRICVRNVKGITERTLEFPDTGVVVVEGPNEVGKSTFLEALDRLLEAKGKASSKAASIVALQPVGQDVGPFVEAEMSVGPHRLIFAKRWLRQPITTLHILSPVPEQLAGEAAQHRMDSIMDSSVDRPLLDALRFAQSGSSSPIRLGDSAVLQAALDGAAGADLHSAGSGDLLDAVETEYRRYYTATTGRPAGDLRVAIAVANESQDAVVEAHGAVGEAEIILGKRDEAAGRHQAAQDAIPGHRKALLAAEGAGERVAALRAQEQHAAQQVEAAALSTRAAKVLVVARQSLIHDGAQRSAAAVMSATQVVETASRTEELAAALAEAKVTLDHARQACARAQEDSDEAAASVQRLQLHAEVASLEDRMGAADRARAEVERHRARLAENPVSPGVWRELERHQQQFAIAEAALEAGSTSVSISSLVDEQHLEHDGRARALSFGEPAVQVLVERESELIINGCVRVGLRPHGDVVKRVGHRDQMLAQLRSALADVRAGDIEQAALMHEAHQRARDDVARAESALAVALSGSTLPDLGDLLRERRGALGAVVSDACEPAHDDVVGRRVGRNEVDQAVHDARALQATLWPLRQEKDAVEDDVHRVRDLHAVATQASGIAHSRQEAAAEESRRAKERLDAQREVASDGALASAAASAVEAERLAAATHQHIDDALRAANSADTDERLWLATSQLAQAQADQERLGQALQHLNGQLEITAGEGRQEMYERAVQAFEEANRALASVDRRARAARQLHETLQRHRERAHATYVAPYAREIERLGRSLYGGSFGIEISPNLVITHRHLHGATVAFDQLSGGAKEQLGIVARLAVAMLIESDQSVPVVIDDALGYTDPQRLELLGSVLGGSDYRGQIILLTCTPDRNRAIPGAQTVRLTA